MACYRYIRPLLHAMPPEMAHNLALRALRLGILPPHHITPDAMLQTSLLGLDFAHPVGIAAGFDKNGIACNALFKQGFGFVEAGTVTPKSQPGNPTPRIFRLAEDQAVINRLGFNNDGVESLVKSLKDSERRGVVGVNIGKNKDSDDALADYSYCIEKTYSFADYITINISSPNTHGLRALQKREALTELLRAVMASRERLQAHYQKRVPLLLKIAPDLNDDDIQDVCNVSLELGVDGLIVSNTTIKRPRTLQSDYHGEQGGLSGPPLFLLSTEILARVYTLTQGKIPLIGVGGVSSPETAYKKIRAGASLVQLYTALVYHGFGVVKQIVEGLPVLLKNDGFSHISEAVGADHR